MKNRKRGFSLVELLIVLAVIAALIATITPVALNAIRKAKATQVAQNIKTLASAFENKLYVDGSVPSSLVSLGRDIDDTKYALYYTVSSGDYTAIVATNESVDSDSLTGLIDVTPGNFDESAYTRLGGYTGTDTFYYLFGFTVY